MNLFPNSESFLPFPLSLFSFPFSSARRRFSPRHFLPYLLPSCVVNTAPPSSLPPLAPTSHHPCIKPKPRHVTARLHRAINGPCQRRSHRTFAVPAPTPRTPRPASPPHTPMPVRRYQPRNAALPLAPHSPAPITPCHPRRCHAPSPPELRIGSTASSRL